MDEHKIFVNGEEKMNHTENAKPGTAKAPIVFVTGIGQTWSSLHSDNEHRWNLIPDDKEVLFHDYPKGGKRQIVRFALQALRTALTGKDKIKKETADRVLQDLLRWCSVDEDGNLPPQVNVRIYGCRSFAELAHIDFATGGFTQDEDKSLLRRIYADIPCRDLAATYGTENMYCFNYSTFSDLYADAEKLHTMLEEVIADQADKTGAKQVILVPMSMGATVVSAYLDKYYTDTAPIGDNLVQKVISVVGAWDGSDGLADLLACNGGENWNEKFYDTMLREALDNDTLFRCLSLLDRNAVNKMLIKLVDCLLDNLLLNISTFMALIPKDRFAGLEEKLFGGNRRQTVRRYEKVKAEAYRYHAAQCNLQNRMYGLRDNCAMQFYFIGGYNIPFGGIKSDFGFLNLFDSADKTNSDSVIQISSTVPGTRWAKCGDTLSETHNCRLSPDKTVDAATAWFPETSWYFEGQEHELGTNNTALRLIMDIAKDEVTDVSDVRYPQFNRARDIRKAEKTLQEAEKVLSDSDTDAALQEKIRAAAAAVRTMLADTHNDPDRDDRITKQLHDLLEECD